VAGNFRVKGLPFGDASHIVRVALPTLTATLAGNPASVSRLDLGEAFSFTGDADDISLPGESLLLIGPQKGPRRVLGKERKFSCLGIAFREGVLPALLDKPALSLRDFAGALSSQTQRFDPLLRALENGEIDVNRPRATLLGPLTRSLAGFIPREGSIVEATRLIRQSKGVFPVNEIARRLQISRQHLNRLFENQLGVSPKLFSRIVRFNALLARIKGQEQVNWADIAFENGFCDQSHLLAEFRDFTGTTAERYLKSRPRSFCISSLPGADCVQ
jgi:AraC-like DNA-binding protein